MPRLVSLLALSASILAVVPAAGQEAFVQQASAGPARSAMPLRSLMNSLATPVPAFPSPPPAGSGAPVGNAAQVVQSGSNNAALVTQVGAGNLAAVLQRGTGNSAVISQTR